MARRAHSTPRSRIGGAPPDAYTRRTLLITIPSLIAASTLDGTVANTSAAAATASPAAPPLPDHDLLVLCASWQPALEEAQGFYAREVRSVADEQRLAAEIRRRDEAVWNIERAIAAAPARSLDGMFAKARAAAQMNPEAVADGSEADSNGDAVAWSVVRDLLREVPG